MATAPHVCVVVLNWDGWPDTVRCLESLQASSYPSLRVIVVDNGSVEIAPDHLDAVLNVPWVDVVRLERNEGFTGGANRGIHRAIEHGADYIFLLNNDAVVAPNCIEQLVRAAEESPRAGFAGPKILRSGEPNRIWSAGFSVLWRRARMTSHDGAADDRRFDECRVVQALSGCALLVRRAVLDEVGLLDERYFAYYEDADWCLRACRAGWRCLYVGDAHAFHKGSATSNRGAGHSRSALVNYYGARNLLLFMYTHGRPVERPLILVQLACQLCAALLRVVAGGLVLRRPGALRRAGAIVLAVMDAMRGRFGAQHQDWLLR